MNLEIYNLRSSEYLMMPEDIEKDKMLDISFKDLVIDPDATFTSHHDFESEQQSTSTTSILPFPPEIEIQILQTIPIKYYPSLELVCKRWYTYLKTPSITFNSRYTSLHTKSSPPKTSPSQTPSSKNLFPKNTDFRNLLIHTSILEIYNLYDDPPENLPETDPRIIKVKCKRGCPLEILKIPSSKTLNLISKFKNDPLTIPPLPHTNQSIKLESWIDARTRPKHYNCIHQKIRIPDYDLKTRFGRVNSFQYQSDDVKEGKMGKIVTVGDFFGSVLRNLKPREKDCFWEGSWPGLLVYVGKEGNWDGFEDLEGNYNIRLGWKDGEVFGLQKQGICQWDDGRTFLGYKDC